MEEDWATKNNHKKRISDIWQIIVSFFWVALILFFISL